MAKIHVQGGSDLRVRFTDEAGVDLYPVDLDPVGNGPWYTVVAKDGKKLQANRRKPNDKYFRSSGDIEIDFKSN